MSSSAMAKAVAAPVWGCRDDAPIDGPIGVTGLSIATLPIIGEVTTIDSGVGHQTSTTSLEAAVPAAAVVARIGALSLCATSLGESCGLT
jgi:hypothetical protein